MFQKFGAQMYTVRSFMQTEEDVRASFRKLKELGYEEAQTAGCVIGHELYGRIAAEEGISIVGSSEPFDTLAENPEKAMENHRMLGTIYIGVGGPCAGAFSSLENLNRFIERANAFADAIYPHGFKFTYHNHSQEFVRLEGKTAMERLVEGLNPEKTSFVLDTYWAQNAGADVRYWIEKLAGRIDILHLKDRAVKPGTNEGFFTEIGEGNLYWDGILDAAEKAGVKHYIVEQDTCPGDPFDSLAISARFLKRYVK